MAIKINDALANKRLDCTFNAAAGISLADGATLQFRSDAKPADANTAPAGGAGAVVASVALNSDGAGAAAARTVTLNQSPALQDISADNAGTIVWARLTSAAGPGTYAVDFAVTPTGSGGDITVDNPTLVAGQQFNVTSLSFSE